MRILISLLCCALLGLAGAWAYFHGAAGEQYHSSARQMWEIRRQAAQSGVKPDATTLTALEKEVDRALRMTPNYSALWLNQALIARTGRLSEGGAVIENLALARSALEAALVNQPQSPTIWAEYAVLADMLNSQKQLEGGSARLNSLMRRALAFAPRETNVHLTMLDLGFRNWEELEPATRTALERALTALNAERTTAALQVAQRRGRMDEACAFPALRATTACAAQRAQQPAVGSEAVPGSGS